MITQEQDLNNLQLILKRIESVQGRKYKEEVRTIIGKYPDASDFQMSNRDTGEAAHKSYAGTKVKGYYVSDDYVFIMILEAPIPGQRKNAKNKKFDRSFLKFKHNTEENGVTEE